MSAVQEYQRAANVLPDAGTSKLTRELHTRLSCAWAEHPDVDADEMLDAALADMPEAMQTYARAIVRAAQDELVWSAVVSRSLPILQH